MIPRPSAGLHHVTAICSNAQRTVDFYVRALGVRFLKRTVNFDDPSTYHLYFGDYVGHPGSALTFFAWKHLPPGRPGAGQAVRVSFKVPKGSLDRWRERLESREVDVAVEGEEGEDAGGGAFVRFGRRTLALRDPDGLGLALVERDEVDPELQWVDGPVDPEMAIAGFHGVTLLETVGGPTAEILGDVLGLRRRAEEDGRAEYVARAPEGYGEAGLAGGRATAGGSALGPRDTVVELVSAPDAAPGRVANGSIHHVAFRAADDEHQENLRGYARRAGLSPTPVIDRYYFRSVYFHEPGGVLLEVATDDPGFTRDQEPDQLGRGLTLPPWLEPRRPVIESRLDPVSPPDETELRRAASGEPA